MTDTTKLRELLAENAAHRDELSRIDKEGRLDDEEHIRRSVLAIRLRANRDELEEQLPALLDRLEAAERKAAMMRVRFEFEYTERMYLIDELEAVEKRAEAAEKELEENANLLDDYSVCDCCYCYTPDPVDVGDHVQCQSCTEAENQRQRAEAAEEQNVREAATAYQELAAHCRQTDAELVTLRAVVERVRERITKVKAIAEGVDKIEDYSDYTPEDAENVGWILGCASFADELTAAIDEQEGGE